MNLPTKRARPAADNTERFARVLEENRRGSAVGTCSICSANRFVLEAGILQAQRDDNLVLIESTSNQVNQFGGYTGQTPAQFASFVREIAAAMNFPAERIVLGGDHWGPTRGVPKAHRLRWQRQQHWYALACWPATPRFIWMQACISQAMSAIPPARSRTKSSAAAQGICATPPKTHTGSCRPDRPAPYVIGTEVPIPGGELLDAQAPETTRTEDVARAVHLAEQAFEAPGLQAAWERVIAVVVQPGVEFGDTAVFPYTTEKARKLSQFAEKKWQGVYEAHSTDYQTAAALKQMVRDHFAILKVGPWLTFAFREAVFALAAVEQEWLGDRKGIAISRVRESLEEAMLANPQYWKSYYRGDDAALRFARK